jgi:hypothetical protein
VIKRKKKKHNILKYIIDRWILFLLGGFVMYFLVLIVLGTVKNHFLNKNSMTINAVVVDEKNYFGNSKVTHPFSYSYEFIIESKKYREDSKKEDLKIGDSVLVEYVDFFPNFSRLKIKK